MANDTIYQYGGDFFQTWYDLYSPVHLPLSAIICIFGVFTNALNVVVLTRKSMLSPTNILLTGLSVAQLCLVTNYLLLLLYNQSADACLWPILHGYAFVFFKWINVNLNVVFHSIATTHTLAISIFRFLAVKAPNYARTRINVRCSRLAVLSIYGIAPVLCCPLFFMCYVGESETKKGMCQLESVFELQYTSDEALIESVMWLFGILFKLLPSSAIAFFSIFLVQSLKTYHKKKAGLTIQLEKRQEDGRKSLLTSVPQNGQLKHHRRGDRRQVTKMLLAVALLCVSVELPHGIVNLLTAVFGQRFAMEVYDNLGDVFEMLTLLYSSVNFILYSLINVEYQKALIALFMDCLKKLPRV